MANLFSGSSSEFDKVGLPSEIVNYPSKPKGTHTPLVSHGQPELIYIWASYCPFCAAENWALWVALSRFGSFTGLSTTQSSVTDFAPGTRTISFYGATYTSKFLFFKSYDLATSKADPGDAQCSINGYTCLQTAPGSAMELFQTIGDDSFPFMDFSNKLAQSGAGYENQPLTLRGLTAGQIAAQLSNPNSRVAREEVGSANYFTAAICAMTGNAPEAICSTPVIEEAETKEGIPT
jgi:thiol-disulfide isomerase/thioredoxin